MKKILIYTFILFVAFACKETFSDIKDPGWEQPDNTNTITVMSYNVKYCSPLNSSTPNVNLVAEIINRVKPDIVFLQEIDKNTTRSGKVDQLALLAQKTNMPYTHFGKSIDYQGGQSGIGILSRYTLSDPQVFKLPRVELGEQYVSYRILMRAIITVNETKITIANTHLELTQENRDLQVPEANKILAASNHPTIFGGDFNATPQNFTMATLFGYGFKKTCTTNCNSIPADSPNREIDFIIYRPEAKFRVISHNVLSDQASDHLPIVSVLEIR